MLAELVGTVLNCLSAPHVLQPLHTISHCLYCRNMSFISGRTAILYCVTNWLSCTKTKHRHWSNWVLWLHA